MITNPPGEDVGWNSEHLDSSLDSSSIVVRNMKNKTKQNKKKKKEKKPVFLSQNLSGTLHL